MADKLYISSTPKEVSEAKGLHLITQNTPNGQAVQIMLEELADAYGTHFTYSIINIGTNIQKDVRSLASNQWSCCASSCLLRIRYTAFLPML